MDILKQLQWRYATKIFDKTKKISEQDAFVLMESLRLTPSSFGLQPWKFIVAQDPALREQLKAAAYNQDQVTDASHFVVLAGKTDMQEADVDAFIDSIAQTREVSGESLDGYRQTILGSVSRRSKTELAEWNARQVYIALGFVMATAASMGIDSCPMEGFDRKAFDRILGLEKQGLSAVVCVALGYRDASDDMAKAKKVRYSAKEIFHTM